MTELVLKIRDPAALLPAAVPGLAGRAAALLAASLPLTAFGLLKMAVSITDMGLVGGLGASALATAALVSDAHSIVFHLVGGGLGAVAPLVAASLAGRDPARAGLQVAAGLRLAALLAVPGFLVVAGLGRILPLLGVPMPDPAAADGFALATAVACAAMVMITYARSVLVAFGRGRPVVIALAAAVPANAGLDVLLMDGVAGLPGLGMVGVAAGTALTYAACAAVLVPMALATARVRGARAPRGVGPAGGGVAAATLLTGLALLCETGLFLASTLLVGAIDGGATAAHVIAFRVLSLCYCAFAGIGQAASVAAARAGSGRPEAVAAAGVVSVLAGLAGAAAVTLAVPPLADAAGAGESGRLTVLAAATVFALSPAATGLAVMRGIGAVRASASAAAAGYWGGGLAALGAAALAGPVGVDAVWVMLLAASSCTAVIAWGRLAGRSARRGQ